MISSTRRRLVQLAGDLHCDCEIAAFKRIAKRLKRLSGIAGKTHCLEVSADLDWIDIDMNHLSAAGICLQLSVPFWLVRVPTRMMRSACSRNFCVCSPSERGPSGIPAHRATADDVHRRRPCPYWWCRPEGLQDPADVRVGRPPLTHEHLRRPGRPGPGRWRSAQLPAGSGDRMPAPDREATSRDWQAALGPRRSESFTQEIGRQKQRGGPRST